MAFVAPAADAAAATAARGAGARATAKGAATKAGAAKAAAGKGTAAARGRQLLAEGKSRKDAARIIRDEFGSTLAEAEGILPDPEPAPEPATDTGSPERVRPPSGGPVTIPRPVSRAADAGGGLLLGAITWVLVMTYLRSGWPGVRRWFAAKFLNRTTDSASQGLSGLDPWAAAGRGVGGASGGTW